MLYPLRKVFKGNNQHFIIFFKKHKTKCSLKWERFGVCYPGCFAVLTASAPTPGWETPVVALPGAFHGVRSTSSPGTCYLVVLTDVSTWYFMKMVVSPLTQSEALEYLGQPECAHSSSPLGPAVPTFQWWRQHVSLQHTGQWGAKGGLESLQSNHKLISVHLPVRCVKTLLCQACLFHARYYRLSHSKA